MVNGRSNNFGIASLVMGVLSLLVPFVGVIFGVFAIVFGRRQNKVFSTKLAKAGIIFGIIGLAINVVLFFLFFIALLAFGGAPDPSRMLPR